MGFSEPNDGRCDHCNMPGKRYVYRGIEFDGLTPWCGEKLCNRCRDRQLESEAPEPSITPIAYAYSRFPPYRPKNK